MVNYDREMERMAEALSPGTPLLLHACCGPCASSVLERLGRRFAVTVLYFNPNIAPKEEYLRRRDALAHLLKQLPTAWPVKLEAAPYQPEDFLAAAAGLEDEPEGGARCGACFSLRLGYAAEAARDLGILHVGTTLSVSPHKNAALLNQIGSEAAAKHGRVWLPGDFKKKDGYRRSIQLSREYGLYRQDYCGCVFSKRG